MKYRPIDLTRLPDERLARLWQSRLRESLSESLNAPGMQNRRQYVLRELSRAHAEMRKRLDSRLLLRILRGDSAEGDSADSA